MFANEYPDYPCANESVDNLEIDPECLKQMKRLGIEYIGDILEDWERVRDTYGGSPRFTWECRCLVYLNLAEINGWPWPEDLYRFKNE